MNKTVFLVLSLFLFTSITAAAKEEYVLTYPKNFPPYFYESEKGTEGMGIELMAKLSELTNIKFVHKPVENWPEANRMIKAGEADIIPDMGVSEKRKEYLLFTDPYKTSQLAFFTRKEDSNIRNLDDIKDISIATVKTNIIYHLYKDRKDINIIIARDQNELLFMLLAGKVDAIGFPATTILNSARTLRVEDEIKIIKPYIKEVKRAIGVSVRYPEIHEELSMALTHYMKTSEFRQLYEKWHIPPKPFWDRSHLTILFISLLTIISGSLLVWRNISLKNANTELSAAKEALAESESKFKIFGDLINDVLWFIKPGFEELIYVSPAYEKIWGKSLESLYENPKSYIENIHPEDKCRLHEEGGIVKEGRTGEKYRVINSETGEIRWVRSQLFPYYDNEGNTIFIAGLTSDITDLVNSENEKALQKQVIVQQSKFASIGEMVGAISHQWRQPLNSAYLCVQMIDEMYKDNERNDGMHDKLISDSMNLIEHMSETIEDFRNFFKNKKDQISFDAPKTVMHTLRIIEPQLKSNNIKYKLGCQCDQRSFECNNSINLNTPECHYLVKGVPNEFKHVILNLIQNSKEALEKCDKERTISIVMSSCKNKIYIDVQDNGLGIPEDILENIFDPYVTAKENGTGMGLYMSKTIIEANMGGKLSAENNNIGALFKIELPVI